MLHPTLAGHLPLQDMIQQTIESARTKLAAAEEKKDEKKDEGKKAPPFAAKKEEKDESKEKKSSLVLDFQNGEEMDKLASALDEMAEDLIKEADSIENGGESKQGGQQLPTQSPTGGTQNYKRDAAKHQIPNGTGLTATKDNPGAATAVPTDDSRAPGGTGAKYPAKGVLKTAMEKKSFSVTEAGHKYDAARAKEMADWSDDRKDAAKEHLKTNPVSGRLSHPLGGWSDKIVSRHERYVQDKHEQGKNAWNPLGGVRTPTKAEKEKKSAVARLQEALEKQAFAISEGGHKYDEKNLRSAAKADHNIGKASQEYRRAHPFLSRLPGTPGSGKRERHLARSEEYAANEHKNLANVLSVNNKGKNTPSSFERAENDKEKKSAADFILAKVAEFHGGGETLDDQAAPVPSNPGRQLIANNSAPVSATKREAKAPRKAELSQVLTEPAMTSSTDSKVQDNLRNAAKGGVKIAEAAKEELRKIAADPTDPRHEALKKAIVERKAEKAGDEKKDSEKTEEKES